MTTLGNFINGTFVPPHSGAYLDDINPSTEEVIAQIPDSDERDIDDAVEAARRAFPAWSRGQPRATPTGGAAHASDAAAPDGDSNRGEGGGRRAGREQQHAGGGGTPPARGGAAPGGRGAPIPRPDCHLRRRRRQCRAA